MSIPNFDSRSYLAANQDLLRAGLTPADAENHYLAYGAKEGRATTFDSAAYLASYTDLQNTFGKNTDAALQHYIDVGMKEGRSISFNALEYLASNLDLLSSGLNAANAAQHYVSYGIDEKRTVSSFDPSRYLAANTDLKATLNSSDEALRHYITTGWKEDRLLAPVPQVTPTPVVTTPTPVVTTPPTTVVSPPLPLFPKVNYFLSGVAHAQASGGSSYPMIKGQTYQADVDITGSFPGQSFNPFLEVGYWHQTSFSTGYLERLAYDDDSGGNLKPRLIFTAPETAGFTFMVSSADGTGGFFTLSIKSL